MLFRVFGVLVCLVALNGCLHGRGVHTIPMERDYKSLEDVAVEDAEGAVADAHRVGGHHFSTYEMVSADHYLEYAEGARAEGDRKGEKDYSALAVKFATIAVENGGIVDEGILPMLANNEEAWAEWERLVALYRELDPCKAKLVAPAVYAHIEANLAQAEHELKERHCHTPTAVRHMRYVEPDIRSIWAKDSDGDGVPDMMDGEPWIAEDADGFQDDDGIPEPKPYPELGSVYFDTDKAMLKPEGKGYLRGIADMLIDGYSEVTVYVTAHTDSDASDEYNQELSQRREKAVVDYLLSQGVKQNMVTSSHKGESMPVADNATEAGKAQNRRAELMIDAPDPTSPFCN